jgi:VWFA-related protein
VIYEYVERNFKEMDVSLVLVNMNVTDPNDRLVTGLEKENFRVFEDGREQEIVTFSSEDVPISIGVIFDMSGSMADKDRQGTAGSRAIPEDGKPARRIFYGESNTYRTYLKKPNRLSGTISLSQV